MFDSMAHHVLADADQQCEVSSLFMQVGDPFQEAGLDIFASLSRSTKHGGMTWLRYRFGTVVIRTHVDGWRKGDVDL